MIRTRALVNKLLDPPGDFMIRKWVEKALPRSTRQKLRESLRSDATLEDFVAVATQIEDARLLFADPWEVSSFNATHDDSISALKIELEVLKLQRSIQEERDSGQPQHLAKGRQELEVLCSQQEDHPHL